MDHQRLTPAPEHGPSARRVARFAGLRQRLYPKHLLSWLMLRATRIGFGPWKNWQIRWFIRRYGVDTSVIADASPASYPHFNAFFTRALVSGARPLEGGPRTVVSPADGIAAETGTIHGRSLIQAKGRTYTLEALFGGDERAAAFEGGCFTTIYLAPRDYHRVHMPVTGRLRATVYVPGELFSVNPLTVDAINGLFARNERVVSFFDTDLGPLAITMVGAVFVGCIELVWQGVVIPPRRRTALVKRYDDQEIVLEQGREMGRFNMGSTVIVTLANAEVDWAPWLEPGAPVQVGRRIGDAARDH